MPTARNQHIHCDIVGFILESRGESYCLSIIVTSWRESLPIKKITELRLEKNIYRK